MHFKIASHIISYSKLEAFEEAEKVESVNGFLKFSLTTTALVKHNQIFFVK